MTFIPHAVVAVCLFMAGLTVAAPVQTTPAELDASVSEIVQKVKNLLIEGQSFANQGEGTSAEFYVRWLAFFPRANPRLIMNP